MTALKIIQVETEEHKRHVKELFWENLSATNLMVLDSPPFAKEAHTLYHSLGFHNREPYPQSEIPQEYHSRWIFMEMDLK